MRIEYDQIAEEYARHRRVHPGVLQDLLAATRPQADFSLLEVGCGTGNYIIALQQAAGCAAWGIDPSAQMLDRARQRSSSVRFQLGQAEKLDFPTASLDLVFSVDVIHHVGDRLAYFKDALRALRPGGRLCTVTDSAEIIRKRRPLTAYFPESAEVELKRYPPVEELKRLMSESGFSGLQEKEVAFPYSLSDLQAYRDKAFSSLHLIAPEAFSRGIQRMEEDLCQAPIPCVSYYYLLWGVKPIEG